jgi:hypothetical protein
MKTIKLLAVAAIALISCGDNKQVPDATEKDGPAPDAFCSNCPAAPTVGMQIDRIGRPAVNTVLVRGFDPTAAAQTAKVAYNENGNKTTWFAPANIGEFAKNLALIDVLDSGVCGNGKCEQGETNANCGAAGQDCPTANQVGAGNGCGNQALYNGGAGGNPNAMSYVALASILADDELFLDTSRMQCGLYLAVEFGVVTGGGNSTCGGRAPQYDVVDFSYSMLAMGVGGFTTDGTFTPKVSDGVGPHTDYLADFPYLGAPN